MEINVRSSKNKKRWGRQSAIFTPEGISTDKQGRGDAIKRMEIKTNAHLFPAPYVLLYRLRRDGGGAGTDGGRDCHVF